MIDVKRFSGIMNTDDKPEDVLAPQHIDALNLRFYGGQNGLTAENVKGNYLIPNAQLPAGNNICIGSFFDQVNQLIYFFNFNSNGNNGIYQLDVNTEVITKVFICNTDSITDILTFNPDYPVHSAAIVYKDGGNLLYWTDGFNSPKYLNVSTVASLAPFSVDMITAAKNAPLTPPDPIYLGDITVTTNNLRKKLFRFSYRWVYANGEKSTFSPISRVPLPVNGYDPNVSNSSTQNNYISVQVYSGNADCKAIEVVGQMNLNNTWSDFFLIENLILDDYNIPNNSFYNYSFYNNGAYTPVAVEETDLYFSYLPDIANTLESLNGNVIVYGGITEGYDPLTRNDVDVSITTGLGSPNVPSIGFSYTGPSSFIVNIGPVVTTGAVYTVSFSYSSGAPGDASPKNISYTTLSTDTVDTIVAALCLLIQGNNISTDNFGTTGVFRVFTSTFLGTISGVSVNVSTLGSQIAQASWKWSCPEKLGLVYFDKNGKTNGVVSFVKSSVDTTDFAVTTPNFNASGATLQVPFISGSINHLPPSWAVAYQWVRADLKPTNFLYWVTNDYADPGDGFLYFCIENLTYQKTKNSGFVPSYEFNEGDRVRVIAAYTGGNFLPYTTGTGASLQLDFEILGTVQRTMTNGNTGTGTFLKVTKPSTLPSSSYQATMLIEMYTPKPINTDGNEFFYEFGQKYDIYTSGGVKYHRGQLTDQNVSNPATFQWFNGDVYFRNREWYVTNLSNTAITKYFMDANYNDYFPSAVNSNGRVWTINPDAKRIYNPTMLRWGGAFEQGTDVNNLNIFRPADFDEIDRSKGSIQRFMVEDRALYVYQERGVGMFGIYNKYIQDSSGGSMLTTTNDIITTNNVRYLQGNYGIGLQPTSLVRGKNVHYFVDPVRGYQVRRAADGLTPISELYKGQFYIRGLLTPYSKNYQTPNLVKSKILGTYNFLDEEYVCCLQGGDQYSSNKLTIVDNGVIPNGDINTPSTLYTVFAGNTGPFTYLAAFAGTGITGDIVHIILSESFGGYSIDYPILYQAGWTNTDLVNAAVTAINGSFFWQAVATTYLGNPAIQITNAQVGAIVSGTVSIEFPALITTFTGVPQVGDVVTVSVSADPPVPPIPYTNFSFTFAAGDTISSMISTLVADINAGGTFTATAVTYNGNPGLTVRKLTSVYNFGSSSLTLLSSNTIDPYTFSFNEKRNGYTSFFSYHPEWIDNAQELIYTWRNGQLYKHDNTVAYCNFYSTQYNAYLTVVFNQNIYVKKSWNSLTEVANDVWEVPNMYTNSYSYGTTTQQSSLVPAEFTLLEANPTSAIKRDANSIGGKLNGNFMKGNYLVVKFQKTNANNLVNLAEVSCRFTDSPLNIKS